MKYLSTKVEQNGRILLPVEIRRLLGVGPGDELLLEVQEHGVRLYTAAQAVQALQQFVKENTLPDHEFTTDDFLAWRRADEQQRDSDSSSGRRTPPDAADSDE